MKVRIPTLRRAEMIVGVEVEFFLTRGVYITEMHPEDVERFDLKPEFYRGMYEKTYLLHKFSEEKETIIKDLKEIADLYKASIPLKSILIPIQEGAASCGIHIHIDEDFTLSRNFQRERNQRKP